MAKKAEIGKKVEAIDLNAIAEAINSKFKEQLVKSGEEVLMSEKLAYISTGCRVLDYTLGGGILLGRVTEIYGEEGSGKSTLAIHLMTDIQRQGGVTVLLDSESNFDKDRAKRIGWDPKKCLILEAPYVEKGFDLIFTSVSELKEKYGDLPILVVWDTLHACPTEAATKGDQWVDGMMQKPRVIQDAMRKLVSFLPKNKAGLVVLNQIISIPTQYGAKTDSTGGHAMRHYPTHRVRLRVQGQIKDSQNDVEGIYVEAKVTKNKVDKPFRELKLPLMFYTGFDDVGSTFEFLYDHKVIVQNGGWFKIPELGDAVFRRSDFAKMLEKKEVQTFVDTKIRTFFPGLIPVEDQA